MKNKLAQIFGLLALICAAFVGAATAAADDVSVEGGRISLLKGNSVTKKIGSSAGFNAGRINVVANWNHAIGPVPGPLPVKLTFQLLRPDGSPVESDAGYASNDENTAVRDRFRIAYVSDRCERGQWKIRITNNSDHDTMNIDPRVTFTPSGSISIAIEGGLISLNKGNSVTKNVGGSVSRLPEGRYEITANWYHAIGPIPGPLPVKLKFELLKPDGSVAASQTAYAGNDLNRMARPRLSFTYAVASPISGQWKIRITNNSEHDTMNIDPKINFSVVCPN